MSEARVLATATCTLFGPRPDGPSNRTHDSGVPSLLCRCEYLWPDTLSSKITGAFVTCAPCAAWCLSEGWAARTHSPVSIVTQPGAAPEEFTGPLHKQIRLGGSVLLQRSSQSAASIHTGLISFGLFSFQCQHFCVPCQGHQAVTGYL